MALQPCGIQLLRYVLVAGPLLGCGDSSGPDNRLTVGRYHYTYDGLNQDLEPMHFEGALVLTFVANDSLAGHWEVPGYNPSLLAGHRFPESDHWFFMATSPEEGVASHSLWGDLSVDCDMSYHTKIGVRTFRGACTLEPE